MRGAACARQPLGDDQQEIFCIGRYRMRRHRVAAACGRALRTQWAEYAQFRTVTMGEIAMGEHVQKEDPVAKAQFAAKRKNHYNEFEMMRRAREMMDEDEDE